MRYQTAHVMCTDTHSINKPHCDLDGEPWPCSAIRYSLDSGMEADQ